jgi:sugar diacid utilization regulator
MSRPARETVAQERPGTGIAGLRRIHLGMIDAVLAGEGIARVAALAAAELGGAVAIVLPAVDLAAIEPGIADDRVSALSRYVADRLLGRPAQVPAELVAEVGVRSGDERLGSVALLDARPGRHVNQILELAALAALTAVTLQDASVTQRRACASLLEDLRSAQPPPVDELVTRARRLGADLTRGAGALCVRALPGQDEQVLAVIAQEFPGALAARRGDQIEALLPLQPEGTREAAAVAARRVARRLRRRAPIGTAPFEPDPARLQRALRVAELGLALAEREGLEPADQLSGSWRLLLGVAARNAGELQALVDSTVGPALALERHASSDLLDTLRAYLDRGANTKSTAAAVHAHRHTVAARLARIRELTGHDPYTPRGQAQLGLGLQALAVHAVAVAPQVRAERSGPA